MSEKYQSSFKYLIASQYFLYFGVLGIFLPYFNLYCYHIGFTGFQIGALSALRSVTLVLFSLAWGVLADRFQITKPMEKGMISLENLDAGLVTKGHIAIYDIYFETGKSEIKGESYDALKTIAEYLKAHSDKKYLVVGHTDNAGDFNANIKLSHERAKAVVRGLIVDHSVNKEQLKSYGVGPAAPVSSNSTDEGKAKNRRVEIVER